MQKIIIKTVNTSNVDYNLEINLKGLNVEGKSAEIITLKGDKLDENTLESPEKIRPIISNISKISNKFEYNFEKNSLVIIKIIKK